jgi:hypothetical protein
MHYEKAGFTPTNATWSVSLGDFNIVIRNYWPKKEALDGSYKNPAIKRVD